MTGSDTNDSNVLADDHSVVRRRAHVQLATARAKSPPDMDVEATVMTGDAAEATGRAEVEATP